MKRIANRTIQVSFVSLLSVQVACWSGQLQLSHPPFQITYKRGADAEQDRWQASRVNTDHGHEKPVLVKADNSCDGTARDSLSDGLGLAVVGALGRYKLALKDAGAHVLEPGINLIISSHNGPVVLSALNQILLPLRERLQVSRTVEALEEEHARNAVKELEREYEAYRRSTILPDQRYLEQLARRIARLRSRAKPLTLLEQPLPGELAAWNQRFPGSPILATHDDSSFSELLEHSRSSRAMLDIALVTKSWHQLSLSAASLEGSSEQGTFFPRVWIIVAARPETVARFLLSQKSLLVGLASCCWLLDGTIEGIASQRVLHWRDVVAKLVTGWPSCGEELIAMTQESTKRWLDFQDWIDRVIHQEPGRTAGFLAQLPRLVCKISTNYYADQSETSSAIPVQRVQMGIAVAERYEKHRRAFVHTWQSELRQREFQELCQSVLSKIITFGPMEVRELCRRYDDMRASKLMPVLSHLIQTDQLVKSANRFDIPQRWLAKLRFEIS